MTDAELDALCGRLSPILIELAKVLAEIRRFQAEAHAHLKAVEAQPRGAWPPHPVEWETLQ